MKSYKDLIVWQRAMDVVYSSYAVAKQLPSEERFGLCSQIRRAAVSIAANIAEGHSRDYLGDYLRHLSVAKGSLGELETLLLLTERLGHLHSSTLHRLLSQMDETGRMLETLSKRLRNRHLEPRT